MLLSLSVLVGAGAYLSLGDEPPSELTWGCVGALLAVFAGSRLAIIDRFTQRAGWAIGLVALGVGLGVAAGLVRVASADAPTLTRTVGPAVLEGWVTSVEPAASGVRLRIRTHAISGQSDADTPDFVRVTHRLSLNVSPGRFVRCYAVLRPPPARSIPGDYDFQQSAWFQKLGAVGYVQGRCRGGVLGAPAGVLSQARLRLGAVRRQIAVFVNKAAGERAGGFAAALVSGDRSFMSQDDQETLRRSGLAHLLAISGLHLGIVGGLVYFVARLGFALIAPLSLRIPVQKPAAIVALIAITFYLLISGASVSTQRAFIMYTVFFSAILIDRPALSLRSFSIAMICVVLFAPESVFAPGFQMSFAATGVLIAIYQAWSGRNMFRRRSLIGRFVFGAQSLFVTSVAASLATAPFALYHFERLAPLGLIANLTAMPIVSLVSVPAAGLSMILAPFGLSEIGLYFFGQSLDWIMAISSWVVELGRDLEVPLKQMPALSLFMFTLTLFAGVFSRRWLRIGLCGAGVAGAIASWVLVQPFGVYWAASGDVFVLERSGQYREIKFVDADALGPLRLRVSGAPTECAAEGCEFKTESGGQIVLRICGELAPCPCAAKGQPAHLLTYTKGPDAAPDQDLCKNTIAWSDIAAEGGAGLRLTPSGHLETVHAIKCGNRPWRQNCAVPWAQE